MASKCVLMGHGESCYLLQDRNAGQNHRLSYLLTFLVGCIRRKKMVIQDEHATDAGGTDSNSDLSYF